MDSASHNPRPARPALTPALICGLALWAGCACALAFERAHASTLLVGGTLACFAGACIVCAALRRRFSAAVLCLALGLTGGMALGSVQAAHLEKLAVIAGSETYVPCTAMLTDDPTPGSYGSTAYARVTTPGNPERLMKVRFARNCPGADEVRYGDVLTFSATPDAVDYATYPSDWNRGVTATVTVRAMTVEEQRGVRGGILAVRKRAIEALGGGGNEEGALLQALICGYRADINERDVYRDFRTCGLAHLVAVSGAHLVIVTTIVSALLRVMRVPRVAGIGLVGCSIGAYLVVAGMPISAVRAAIMSLFGSCSFFARRRSSSVNATGIAVLAIVLSDPQAALSLSFALSALSALGIILFSGYVSSWFEQGRHALPAGLSDPLALTIAASLMSVPLSSAVFSQLPLVSPLANIATAPFFPIVCGLGLAASLLSLGGGPAFSLAFALASAATRCLCALVSLLARIPFASIPVAGSAIPALALTGALAAALYIAWPKPSLKGLGACCSLGVAVAVIVALRPASPTEIVMLDVGQGDAFLVRSERACMLIDTGNQDGKLLTALARENVRHLDAVLITHADDDHCGSLDALQGTVVVDRVIVANDMLTCDDDSCRKLIAQARSTASEVVGARVGDRVAIGRFQGCIIWPHAFSNDGGNEDSLCAVFDADVDRDGVIDETALFTGDIDAASLKTALAESGIGTVDVLKVGHHGSTTSTDADLAKTLRPRVALVSVGERNRYGHPKQQVIDELAAVGAEVVRSDESGDVSCELEVGSVQVRTQR
jgi:competence protein ComEC